MKIKDYEKRAIQQTSINYIRYIDQLKNMALSRYTWVNLPETVSERWLEMTLIDNGVATFFKDDILGFLGLEVALSGEIGVYNTPIKYMAYSSNGYQIDLNANNSVLIWNNLSRTSEINIIRHYATQLSEIDRIISVNLNAQKTPIAIKANPKTKLNVENAYMKYEGGCPVIFTCDDKEISFPIEVIRTDAPYLIDKLYDHKIKIWKEALKALGIPTSEMKKERKLKTEIEIEQGDYIATAQSSLKARKQAVAKINEIFNLNIDVVESFEEIEREENENVEIYNNN